MFELCFLAGLLLATLPSPEPPEEKPGPAKKRSAEPAETSRSAAQQPSGHRAGRRGRTNGTDERALEGLGG